MRGLRKEVEAANGAQSECRRKPLQIARERRRITADVDHALGRCGVERVHSFSGTYGDYRLGKVSKVFPQLKARVL